MRTKLGHFVQSMKRKSRAETILSVLITVSLIVGVVFGFGLNPVVRGRRLTDRESYFLGLPGEVFKRMMKVLTIPLVVTSSVCCAATVRSKSAGVVALLVMAYWTATNAAAVIVSLAVAFAFRPGEIVNRGDILLQDDTLRASDGGPNFFDSSANFILNLVPENLINAGFQQKSTNVTDGSNQFTNGGFGEKNFMGLIAFCLLLGMAIRKTQASQLLDMIAALHRVVMYVISIFIWFAPVGIFSIIAHAVGEESHLIGTMVHFGYFVGTVMTAFFVYGMILLPIALLLVARKNPITLSWNNLDAMMCAVGTGCSKATLPVTLKCLEQTPSMDKRVSKFMLPISSLINNSGTVIYVIMAVVYIAQRSGLDLTAETITILALAAPLTSVLAGGHKYGGIVSLWMVLQALGLPTDMCNLVIAVDWLLGHFGALVNTYSDIVGVAVVSRVGARWLKSSETDASEPC